MPYVQEYNLLREIFNSQAVEIKIPGSDLLIRNVEFQSQSQISKKLTGTDDETISENFRFRYPIMMHKEAKADHAIIFLNGLNERSWHKHLAGAKYLAEKSGKAVILFPLSYHINRGLPEWSDVRKMAGKLETRKSTFKNITDATVVNYALSERLTQQPGRFFVSGMQSTTDLLDLVSAIKSGNHPYFQKNARIDFFAYSISCMLLQSLMISENAGALKNSRIVLFAGGSLFLHIQGISRFIMDSVAFDSIKRYYTEIINSRKRFHDELKSWIVDSDYGRSFMAMLKTDFLKAEREKAFRNYEENLLVLALHDDRVMPVEGIKLATGQHFIKSGQFREFHFNYPYTHENPFPVLNKRAEKQVEQAFSAVYNTVLKFFTP